MLDNLSKILEALAAKTGQQPRRSANGWESRCPAHDDRRPSLSISTNNDGGVLLCCHAGCPTSGIVAALGLTMRDLMGPIDASKARPAELVNRSKPTNGSGDRKTFATAREAVAALDRQHGKRFALWTYHDGHGEPVGLVARWNRPDGTKDIRPVSRYGTTWRIGGMPEPRPLYRLPELADAECVYVCEGEKASDAIRALGLVGTTSAGGCKASQKSDWAALAGKAVAVLPDNDEPGERYADEVVDPTWQVAPRAYY